MDVVIGICRRIMRKFVRIFFCTNCLPGKVEWLEMNSLDGESEVFRLLAMNSGGECRKAPLLGTYGDEHEPNTTFGILLELTLYLYILYFAGNHWKIFRKTLVFISISA